MKRSLRKLAMLFGLCVMAGVVFPPIANAQAITFSGWFGSSSLVPGAAVVASGPNWQAGANTNNYRTWGYFVWVNDTKQCRVVQVTPFGLYFFIPPDSGVVKSITIKGGFVNQKVVIVPVPVAVALPTIRAEGEWVWFLGTPGGEYFNGSIPVPLQASTFSIFIAGADFGPITNWIVRITGNGVDELAPLALRPLSQGLSPVATAGVEGLVGNPGKGTFLVQITAANDPSIVSNIVTITFP